MRAFSEEDVEVVRSANAYAYSQLFHRKYPSSYGPIDWERYYEVMSDRFEKRRNDEVDVG